MTDTEDDRENRRLFAVPPDPDAWARLHRRLDRAAQEAGLLDIAYTTTQTPVGSLLLAATEKGLIRVAYENEDHEAVLQTLARRVSPRIMRSTGRLESTVQELEEYFAGRRREFDLPLDLSLSRGFRLAVQQILPEIGYGHTASYAQVAERAGNPRATRAVGTACATNPLPVVVPCHRVLRTDGTLGGYIGGSVAKTTLLELEAAG